MKQHPQLSLLFAMQASPSGLAPLVAYLEAIPHVRVDVAPVLPENLSDYDVVITLGTAKGAANRGLEEFVHAGGGWLAVVDASPDPLPALLGVAVEPPGPEAELRVLFEKADHPLGARLPDALYLTGRYQVLKPTDEDTETLLYADWHYAHTPVLTQRPVGRGRVACTTLQAFDHPVVQQICYRLLVISPAARSQPDPLRRGYFRLRALRGPAARPGYWPHRGVGTARRVRPEPGTLRSGPFGLSAYPHLAHGR